MFRIKICGITNAPDASAAIHAGADAIGLNFFPESRRYVNLAMAQEITASLPSHVAKVGVFVNEDLESQIAIADQLRLDYLQLHGDEHPEHVSHLAPRSVIRAFRFQRDELDQIVQFVQRCRQLGTPLAGVLVDAYQAGSYGGTGKTVDWEGVRELGGQLPGQKIILAGGIRPANVEAAIASTRPWGVDVASGVESSPGQKDPIQMEELVNAARHAFDVMDDGAI